MTNADMLGALQLLGDIPLGRGAHVRVTGADGDDLLYYIVFPHATEEDSPMFMACHRLREAFVAPLEDVPLLLAGHRGQSRVLDLNRPRG